MSTRKFDFALNGVSVLVEAEQDGQDRYMVYMAIPGRMWRVRVGYLTGARRNWLAEFFGGKKPSLPAGSAKEACLRIAEWALKQPPIAPYVAPGT